MRVARILGRANVGGPARTVLALCRRLAASGVETLLLVGRSGPAEGDLLAGVTDVAVARVEALRRAPSPLDLLAGREIARRLADFAPDVVHTHAAKAGVLGRRAALRLRPRPKLVHTFHGHVLDGYFPRPVAALFAAVERRLARDTDALVAVGARVADELAIRHRVAPRAAFRVIENGIDLSRVPPPDAGPAGREARQTARAALGFGGHAGPVLAVPARLVPIKDHALLFAALARLPPGPERLVVVCLGDGPLRARLAAAARRLPEHVEVRFPGFVPDVPAVLPAADVVALASRNEGQPLALLEAFAAGVPVAATAVGGVPDLVEDGVTGLLAPPGDTAALARVLERLLRDPALRARLAAAARERVFARHDLDRAVADHLRLYRELLET